MSVEHVRVLVVDDRNLSRCALRGVLDRQQGICVAGEAANAEELTRQLRELDIDVVLIDSLAHRICPVETTRQVVCSSRTSQVVVLSNEMDDQATEAVAAGACGLVLKSVTAEELVPAIRIAAAGYLVLPQAFRGRTTIECASGPSSEDHEGHPVLDSLTERERDVLLLLGLGLSNLEISDKLVLSESTVKSHVQHMLNKLGLPNRVHAVILAYELGIIQVGQGNRRSWSH
jgi:DNA-binding NarL/FixJ family response regulator